MEKKREEVEAVEEIEYEKYIDSFALIRKKGVFSLLLGQAVYDPPKMLARIWIDAASMKTFAEFLQDEIKKYEKEFGKIE